MSLFVLKTEQDNVRVPDALLGLPSPNPLSGEDAGSPSRYPLFSSSERVYP